MTTQEIIEKIRQDNEREKRKRGFTTDLHARFLFVIPDELVFDRTNSTPERPGYGYYILNNGVPTWIGLTIQTETFRVQVDAKYDSECIYNGVINENLIFIIETAEDQDDIYLQMRSRPGTRITYKFNIPKGAKSIVFSSQRNRDFKLTVQNDNKVDVTRFLTNTADSSVLFQRDDLSGVFSEYSNEFNLCGLGRELLKTMFNENGLYSIAKMEIYRRKSILPYNMTFDTMYVLQHSVSLDWENYSLTRDIARIGADREDILSYYESGKSSKFDIAVNDIKDGKQWNNTRLTLQSSANYQLADLNFPTSTEYNYFLFIDFQNSELVPGTSIPIMQDQESGNYPADKYFFKAVEDMSLTIRMKFRAVTSNMSDGHTILLTTTDGYGKRWELTGIGDGFRYVDIDETISINLTKDAVILLLIELRDQNAGDTYGVMNSGEFYIRWSSKGNNLLIDVINPETILQKYLDLICRTPNRFKGVIEWEESFKPMLCAGESIRGFDNAFLHGSLKDFVEWMNILGYEYNFTEDSMIFKRRYKYFTPDVTALELSTREVANEV